MLHPCDHIPAEIWIRISDKLAPQDLFCLSDAHPFWYKMLEWRRSEFMMQLCLPLVADRQLSRLPSRHLKFSVGRVLSLEDILNIRLLSKGCNRAVEHYFQHHVYENENFINENFPIRADFDDDVLSFLYRDKEIYLDFSSSSPCRINVRHEVVLLKPYTRSGHNQDIRQCEIHRQNFATWLDSVEMEAPFSNNPILSRAAAFCLDSVEDQHGCLDLCTRFLTACGEHLERCVFVFDLGSFSWERRYSILRDWVSLVPNLVSLAVIICTDYDYPAHANEDMSQFVNYIQSNPLPDLPCLSRLRTRMLSPPFQNAMLQKYNRVEKLDIEMRGCVKSELFHFVQMDNLNTLTVRIGSMIHLANFQRLFTDSWVKNLKTLECYMEERWSNIISFLNKNFSNAHELTELYLRIPHTPDAYQILHDTHTSRLTLPRVEQLKLSVQNVFLLDFLLPMGHSLKKLAVSNRYDDGTGGYFPINESVECLNCVVRNNHSSKILPAYHNIQWNGWLGESLLYSNIWKLFPNLDFLRVQNWRGWTYRKRSGALILTRADGTEQPRVD